MRYIYFNEEWNKYIDEDDLLEDGVDDIFIKKEKDEPYIDDDYDC